jgi:hypothetical protein
MRTFARMLGTIGPVEPFDYPYALEGRRRPDPPPKLIAAHRAALAALRASTMGRSSSREKAWAAASGVMSLSSIRSKR